MTEQQPNQDTDRLEGAEEAPEHIPSAEEVGEIFAQLLPGEAYTEVKRVEDEQGLYRLDILIQGADGSTEYSYLRKGNNPMGGRRRETVVNVIFYDADGMPISGSAVAKCDNGNWTLTP